jgi:hypothetical protein
MADVRLSRELPGRVYRAVDALSGWVARDLEGPSTEIGGVLENIRRATLLGRIMEIKWRRAWHVLGRLLYVKLGFSGSVIPLDVPMKAHWWRVCTEQIDDNKEP